MEYVLAVTLTVFAVSACAIIIALCSTLRRAESVLERYSKAVDYLAEINEQSVGLVASMSENVDLLNYLKGVLDTGRGGGDDG